MARRFWFPATTAAAVSPAIDAGWQYTTEYVRRKLNKHFVSGTSAAGTAIGAWTSGYKAIDRQYVSDPLAAQTISGTVTAVLMVREWATDDNVDSLVCCIKVVSNDGSTVLATLLALGTYHTPAEFINSASCRNQLFLNAQAISSYDCAEGDRLVVELGYTNSVAGTTPTASARYNGTSDCAANSTGTTALAGWIEFSSTITFQPLSGSGSASSASAASGSGLIVGEVTWTGSGSASSASGTSAAGEARYVQRLWMAGPTTKPAPVSVAYDAAWPSVGIDPSVARLLTSVRADASTYTTFIGASGTGAADTPYLWKQFVSAPLRVGDFAGTIRMMVMVSDGTGSEINKAPCCLRVVSNDGTTVKATLLAVGDQAHDFGSATTGSTSYGRVALNYATLTPYTCAEGDRLVLEVGRSYYTDATPSLGTGRLSCGIQGNDIAWGAGGYFNVNGWLELFVAEIGFIREGVAAATSASACAGVGEIGPGNFGWATAASAASGVGEIVSGGGGTVWTGSGSSTSSTESTALGGTVFTGSGSSTSDTDETASAYLLAVGSASVSSSTSASGIGGTVFSASGSSTSVSSASGTAGIVYAGSSSQLSVTDSSGSGYLEAVGSSSVSSTTSSSGTGVLKAAGSGSVSSASVSSGAGYLICRGSSSVSAVTDSPGIGHTFILASGVSTSSSQSSGLGGTVFSASDSSTSASVASGAGGQVFLASGSSTSDTESAASGGTVFVGSSTTSSSSASIGNGSALLVGNSSSSSSSVSSGAGYLRAAGFGSSVSQTESTGSGGANWANNLGLAASIALVVGVGSLINAGSGFASSETFSEGRGRIKQYAIISVSTETEKQPDKQTFLKRRDRCIISSFQQDFYKRVVTPVRLFKANKDPDFDSLYLERENDFDTPGEWVEVKAYVRFDPQHIETKKEGIEQYRPVIIDFSVGVLKKAGIEKPVFGDVVQITGELYRITGFSNRDYVNHAGDFLTHSVIAAKIRPSSIHDPGLTLKPLDDYIPEDTVLGSRRDYLYYWDQQINFFLKVFPKVAVYQRPEEVIVDLLYQEVAKENKLDWIRHDYPANLTLNPQAADLKKFGIELWRDCKLVVSIPLLKQYGYPLPAVNSIFATEKEFYKITDVFPTNYVTSAWIPLNIVLLGVKYRPSNLEPDEIPTIEQSRTLFFPEHDVQYASSAFAEFNERSFTYVQFIDRNRDSQDFDLLYLEDLEDWKTKGIRYQIPCYVRLEPNAKFLKKFGIDSERDIHISLSKSLADKYMPFERGESGNRMKYPGVGTVVIVEGEPYIITDSPPQHYFGNVYNEEGRALGIIFFGKKLRSSSFDEREKVYDADQVPEPEKPPSGDDYL